MSCTTTTTTTTLLALLIALVVVLAPNSSRLPKLPHLFSQLLKTPARGALHLPCTLANTMFFGLHFAINFVGLSKGGWGHGQRTVMALCPRLRRRRRPNDRSVVFLLHHHRLCHCDFIATESRPIGPPRRLTLAFRLTFTTNFVLLHRHHHHRLCHCRREPRPIGPPDPPTLDLSPPPPFDLALRSLTTTITSTTMTINCLQPAVLECKSLLNRCTTGTFLALLIALIVLVAIRFGRPTSFEGIGRWIRLCRLRLALREVYYQAPPTLAQLRALPPLPRVAGLTEFRDSYAKDGPGAMYVTAVAANNAWKKFCSGLLPADDFLADLRVKVGHAKKLPVRQRQYQKCDVDQRHFWLFCFLPQETDSRRTMCHLCMDADAPRTILHCARGCGKHHTEYWWLKQLGASRRSRSAGFGRRLAPLLSVVVRYYCTYFLDRSGFRGGEMRREIYIAVNRWPINEDIPAWYRWRNRGKLRRTVLWSTTGSAGVPAGAAGGPPWGAPEGYAESKTFSVAFPNRQMSLFQSSRKRR
ncbi:hypothetical protein C8F04DRAFT_1203435 [Mycena alexandri]|uniref:Uncharacterized protein n=1 Tax=Mycena alexandri TaxID=1745969 RepID=A0AAD6WKW8_9AGAR|nr:hypothetical protein C8F04DRAFT_1203435 [Mycena alexandri]